MISYRWHNKRMADGIDKDSYNNGDGRNFGTGMPYLLWFFIYMLTALVISFLVPFPLSLIAFVAIFIPLQIYRIHNIKKRLDSNRKGSRNQNQARDDRLSKISNSISNRLFGNPLREFEDTSIKFYCLSCGREHRERACPSCGSRAVRTE